MVVASEAVLVPGKCGDDREPDFEHVVQQNGVVVVGRVIARWSRRAATMPDRWVGAAEP